jgi:hypothetical protein
MILAAAEFSLQDREPRLAQAMQPHLAAADRPGQCHVQPRPLVFDVEAGVVRRARDHHQDFEPSIDWERPDALGQVEEADKRGIFRQRQEAVEVGVIEIFPRDIIEFGRVGNAQAQAQSGILRLRLSHAGAPASSDIAAQDRIVETLS